jgi:hypothetical protein
VSDAIPVLTDRKSLLSEDSLLERVIAAAEERQLSIHSSTQLPVGQERPCQECSKNSGCDSTVPSDRVSDTGLYHVNACLQQTCCGSAARTEMRFPAVYKHPGHLTGHDEWIHSPIRPGSGDYIRSGMPFQVDVIPVPLRNGWALNCEDAVIFAEEPLRTEIRAHHPATWQRIELRQAFYAQYPGRQYQRRDPADFIDTALFTAVLAKADVSPGTRLREAERRLSSGW